MALEKKFRRGTSAEMAAFTGAEGELTVDTTKDTLVVHDGLKVGGHPLAKENLTNAPAFVGASENLAGVKGLVPAPLAGENERFLRADGTWTEVAATAPSDAQVETAYNNQVPKVTGPEITDGTQVAVRRYSPADIVALIDAHSEGGGTPGEDGASAYQVAVANGFTGTEAQWLASLVGPQGPQGNPGSAGAAGETGPAGQDGTPGAKGDKGDPGDPGDDGVDGDSGYQVAVANGFVGTEAEWLASLKGAKGDTGDTGAKGDKGDTGTPGTNGTNGADGAIGPTGPGFTTATQDANGHLILTKTDTTTIDVGLVKGAKGDKGDTGTAGTAGAKGDPGVGVPVGGTTGQVLTKSSATDYATSWTDPGLYSVTSTDSATIDFSGLGTSASPLTAALKLSATAGNELTTNVDGLYYTSVKVVTIITDGATARSMALADSAAYLRMTNSAAKTITVPTNATVAFPLGTVLSITNAGSGALTFAGASGVILNKLSTQSLVLNQFGTASLTKVGTDEWDLAGSMNAN